MEDIGSSSGNKRKAPNTIRFSRNKKITLEVPNNAPQTAPLVQLTLEATSGGKIQAGPVQAANIIVNQFLPSSSTGHPVLPMQTQLFNGFNYSSTRGQFPEPSSLFYKEMRRQFLNKINIFFKENKSTTNIFIICGLSGMGKSQLSMMYFKKYQDNYKENRYWVDANNYISIIASFYEMARNLKIVTENDSIQYQENTIIKKVYEKISALGKVGIVFDNAKSISTLMQFLPYNFLDTNLHHQFDIIISTLNTNRQDFLWDSPYLKIIPHIIQLAPLDSENIEDMRYYVNETLKNNNKKPQDDEVDELIKRLNAIPIVIAHVIHYISYIDNQNIRSFIKIYDENSEIISKVIAEELPEKNTHFPAYVAWTIIAKELLTTSEQGFRFMCQMSYMHHTSIKISFFKSAYESSMEIISIVQLLKRMALIETIPDSDVFYIHDLLQLVIRVFIKKNPKLDSKHSSLLEILKFLKEKLVLNFENLQSFKENEWAILHLLSVSEHHIQDHTGILNAIDLLLGAGNFYRRTHKPENAHQCFSRANTLAANLNKPETQLKTLHNVGRIAHTRRKEIDQSINTLQAAAKLAENRHGDFSVEHMTVLNDLAYSLSIQSKNQTWKSLAQSLLSKIDFCDKNDVLKLFIFLNPLRCNLDYDFLFSPNIPKEDWVWIKNNLDEALKIISGKDNTFYHKSLTYLYAAEFFRSPENPFKDEKTSRDYYTKIINEYEIGITARDIIFSHRGIAELEFSKGDNEKATAHIQNSKETVKLFYADEHPFSKWVHDSFEKITTANQTHLSNQVGKTGGSYVNSNCIRKKY